MAEGHVNQQTVAERVLIAELPARVPDAGVPAVCAKVIRAVALDHVGHLVRRLERRVEIVGAPDALDALPERVGHGEEVPRERANVELRPKGRHILVVQGQAVDDVGEGIAQRVRLDRSAAAGGLVDVQDSQPHVLHPVGAPEPGAALHDRPTGLPAVVVGVREWIAGVGALRPQRVGDVGRSEMTIGSKVPRGAVQRVRAALGDDVDEHARCLHRDVGAAR